MVLVVRQWLKSLWSQMMVPQTSWKAFQATAPQFQLAGIGNVNEMDSTKQDEVAATNEDSFWDQASLWFAAPKSKITRSRKRMRASNKGLKNISHMELCDICGQTKLRHRLCMDCYKKGKYDIE